MGMMDKLFGRLVSAALRRSGSTWLPVNGYSAVFTSWDGAMYESDLCRAAIDALARHSAKLAPTVQGAALPHLQARLKAEPNPFMTWYQFLYRARTILENQNTLFLVPVYDSRGRDLEGYFPVLPSSCEVRDMDGDGEAWLRYTFLNGQTGALPFDECGVVTKHQYKDDFFGESNQALSPTLDLIHMEQSGIKEGIKNGATFRFMAKVTNFTKPEDLAKERARFNKENLQGEGAGGLLLFPNTYGDIQQIEQKAYAVDAEQMRLIQTNVFNYFGVNEEILQNKSYGDAWNAFYEGAIEPFAIQLSEVMTAMTYSPREIATGNRIFFTSNRLQYASNNDKLLTIAQLVDRGVFNRDEAREVLALPPLPNGEGQAYVIRGEYKDALDTQNQKGVDTHNAL